MASKGRRQNRILVVEGKLLSATLLQGNICISKEEIDALFAEKLSKLPGARVEVKTDEAGENTFVIY